MNELCVFGGMQAEMEQTFSVGMLERNNIKRRYGLHEL
jgi:hypothetical protein